jgi:hypothetical protein
MILFIEFFDNSFLISLEIIVLGLAATSLIKKKMMKSSKSASKSFKMMISRKSS